MEVFFKKSFLKDFERLPLDLRSEVKKLCEQIFPELESVNNFRVYPLSKIRGFNFYYRIRSGAYRIGLEARKDSVIFMRVLHRKDIYRRFP